MYTKMIVIVDESVNVQNVDEVLQAVLQNVNGSQDVVITEGPLEALDHSSNQALYGSKLGIDATYVNNKTTPENISNTYKFILVHKERPWQGKEELKAYLQNNPDKFVIAVDDSVDPNDISTIMWKFFNNIDAKRDLTIMDNKIGIDATRKWKEEGLTRIWPNDIVMSDEMQEYVSKRWDEYGIK